MSGGDDDDDDDDDDEGDGDGEVFSTLVVRSTVRPSERESVSVKGMGDSTMGLAVASMQAVGDLGFGKQWKGSGSSQGGGEEGWHPMMTKMSSSSIPESVTKYELLNELGRCCKVLSSILIGYWMRVFVGFGIYGI
jgi:hypothetical protein